MPTYGDNTTSNSRYFQRGVFIDKVKIISVEDVSNYPKKPGAEIITVGKNGWQPELCLKLKVNTGIEMDMYITGKFNWRTDSISGKKLEYLGWKQQHNGVQNLIYKLLGRFETDPVTDVIPTSLLNRLVGLEFYRLRYCQTREKMYEGKPSTQTWNIFERAIDLGDDILYKQWLKIAGDKKDYDPNLWDEFQDKKKEDETKFKVEEEDVI